MTRGEVFKKQYIHIANSRWILWLIMLVMVSFSLVVWHISRAEQILQLENETQSSTLIVARNTEIVFQGVSQGLERLSMDLNIEDHQVRDLWDEEFARYLEDYPDIEALFVVDTDFSELKAYPETYSGLSIEELEDDFSLVTVIYPIYDGSVLKGFLIGLVDMYRVIESVFEEYQGQYHLRLFQNGVILLEIGDWYAESDHSMNAKIILNDYNSMTISIAADPAYIDDHMDPTVTLLFALLLISMFIVLIAYIAQNNHKLSRLNLKQHRDLLENVDLVAFSINLDGDFTFVNDYFINLSGYTGDELDGANIFDVFFPQFDDEYRWDWLGKLQHGSVMLHEELQFTLKDGRERSLLLNNTILRNTQGEVIGFSSIGDDITEQKELEKRNRELAEQFAMSQRLESLGKLAGGIAHDFNNLLVPIIGYADIGMMQAADNDDIRESFSSVKEAGEKASALTKQILAFSRKQMLKLEVVDLNGVIDDFKSMLYRLIGEDIEVKLDLAGEEAFMKADKGQIEQIIMNLAVNSRDAMPDGGMITISTEVISGDTVVLRLRDTGPGIPPEIRSHIFEPFYTTKPKESGTGLGLSTVFGIVKQHNGTIDVESTEGEGCEFIMRFPSTYELLETKYGSVQVPAMKKTGDETIAVVEDNRQVLGLVENILRSNGYTVISYQDPRDAEIGIPSSVPLPDLILSDVIMPHMDGLTLIDVISEQCPGIPALFMSGYTSTEIAKHINERDDISLMQKPFSADSLLLRIREALERR